MADWTLQQIEDLRKHWADGYSCSVIARMMGSGFTRSAIIGKVHRLKLKPRGRPHAKAGGTRRARALYQARDNTVPRPVLPPPVQQVMLPPQPPKRRGREHLPEEFNNDTFLYSIIPMLQEPVRDILNIPKAGQCRYIFGDVKDRSSKWCRASTPHSGDSWCAKHRMAVYQPAELRYKKR